MHRSNAIPRAGAADARAGSEQAARTASIWIAIGLAAGPMISVGLARFAYALLLPAMRLDLGWSYAAAGAMNAANAVGYLLGALSAAWLAARFGTRRMFLIGNFATAVALVGCGLTANFAGLLFWRCLAGLFGAFAFIIGATLTAEAGHGASPRRQGLFISIYFAGAGCGVVLSSMIAPLALAHGAASWRGAWIAFGAVAIVAAAVTLRCVRYRNAAAAEHGSAAESGKWKDLSLAPLTAAYVLFGAGYIAYMTFMVAFLRSEGFHVAALELFWIVIGLTVIAACFFWAHVFARLQGGWPMLIVLTMSASGASAPLLSASATAAFLSAVLFGGSLMAAPSAVTAFVRKVRPPHAWTKEIARLTLLFGTGQCMGPLLAGYLSDGPSGIRLGLSVSATLLLIGAGAAALQSERSDGSRAA